MFTSRRRQHRAGSDKVMAAIVPLTEEGDVSGNVSGNLQLGATHDVAALGLRQQKMLETGDEDVDECNFAAGEHDSRTPSATSSIPPGAVQVSGGLTFSSNFESGNIGLVRSITPLEVEVTVRPDTNNTRYRLWYYFSVSGTTQHQRLIFHITNMSKSKSSYREGMSPLVRSSSRPAWQRLPETNVFYYRKEPNKATKKEYVLSFLFEFDRPADTYYFAYSYPYTYTDLQKYLFALDQRKGIDWYSRELLCRSVQNRRIDLLTITSASASSKATASQSTSAAPLGTVPTGAGHGMNAGTFPSNDRKAPPDKNRREAKMRKNKSSKSKPPPQNNDKRKKVVIITSRVHPGETPAQYILQGIIDLITSDLPEAKLLRDNVIFKVIPMLNPDGVFLGNYRCSYMGYDLNRCWGDPTDWCHPEIAGAKRLIMSHYYDDSKDNGGVTGGDEDLRSHIEFNGTEKVDVFLDIHAHSSASNSFMYCNSSSARRDREFPRLLSERAPDFKFHQTKFDQDPSKEGTGRRELGAIMPGVRCYTLEVSFFAAVQKSGIPIPYTQHSYMELGKCVALTFADLYKLDLSSD